MRRSKRFLTVFFCERPSSSSSSSVCTPPASVSSTSGIACGACCSLKTLLTMRPDMALYFQNRECVFVSERDREKEKFKPQPCPQVSRACHIHLTECIPINNPLRDIKLGLLREQNPLRHRAMKSIRQKITEKPQQQLLSQLLPVCGSATHRILSLEQQTYKTPPTN